MNIAKGSAGELITQIIIEEQIGYIDSNVSESWQAELIKISRHGALIKMKKSKG